MGSLFTTSPKSKISVGMGKKQKVPFYLQFVPGNVVDVVTSSRSMFYGGSNTINTILAIPHISNTFMDRRYNIGEKNRYWPLFRGMVDVPAKGDPVLLCTVGGKQYYLGPLNTDNNPNWNNDKLKSVEKKLKVQKGVKFKSDKAVSDRESNHESTNFFKINQSRLTKKIDANLDFKWSSEEKNELEPFEDANGKIVIPPKHSITETHGDMLFEGRHGNSIRIGSRYLNPYIYLSNSRFTTNDFESTADGSLISMTSRGSIRQHFGNIRTKSNNPDLGLVSTEFKLPSDTVYKARRYMNDMVRFSNSGLDKTSDDILYKYNKNQTLFCSDRIMINSNKEDTYMSSFRDTHIGSGRHTTISTNEDFIIESRNIYLGRPVNYTVRNMSGVCEDNSNMSCTADSDCDSGVCIDIETEKVERNMEPIVLGKQLLDVLNDLISCLSTACYITPSGAPAPIIDTTSAQLSNKDNPVMNRKSLQSIKGDLQKILSNYHFIEPNIDLTKDQ